MSDSDKARRLYELAQSRESGALLALLCSVAVMLVALAAAYLDVQVWCVRFCAAGAGFFLLMLWLGRSAAKLRTAASRAAELERRLQLRISARS